MKSVTVEGKTSRIALSNSFLPSAEFWLLNVDKNASFGSRELREEGLEESDEEETEEGRVWVDGVAGDEGVVGKGVVVVGVSEGTTS